MVGGRVERGSRRQTRAASAVVPFPRAAGDRLDLARLVPTGRSLLLGFALVAGVLVAMWGARETSVFAVERIQVVGAPPPVARQVQRTTAGTLGVSLVEIDARELEARIRALPSVAGVAVDRSFPHTLVVRVAPERPVAVVRRRASSWLVTGSGKVIREIETGSLPGYPRLWVPRGVGVRVGASLPAGFVPSTRLLAELERAGGIPRRARHILTTDEGLVLVLRRGPEIRFGEPRDLRLKLAVAARVFPYLPDGAAYLDVSVPERPVASRYDLKS